jgi:protein-tyrosine phosphatase
MPDYRSFEVAKKHGINISDQKARQFNPSDFQNFDLIYVMDKNNYADIVSLTNDANESAKVQLFIKNEPVPDPYMDDALFGPVYQLISAQCEKLLQTLKKVNS